MKKQSLRTQLLWSHLALVGLMAVLMLGAVFNFFRLGRSIDRILKDNYKSVVAAQTMKESLERQDSAATFFLAGQKEKATKQFRDNVPIFQKALEAEANNITERGEQQLSDDIAQRFAAYRKNAESLLFAKPPLTQAQARDRYFRVLEPQFMALKTRAQDVLDLNQRAIERADERAKSEARRASLLGLVLTVGALALAVAFAHRAINSALTPLLALSQGAEEIGAGHLNRRIELHRGDEIGTLAQSFNSMAEKLREARRVEQQRLHRAQKMSDAALESLYDPVIVTDATGSVVHLNRAAQSVFGSAERASGLPVSQVVNEPRIVQAVECAAREEQVSAGEDDFVSLQVDGTEHVYRLRATPMRDDDNAQLGAALVLEDVTHLRELDRLKTEFIGVASHELRTPVTSLALSAQLLQEGVGGALTAVQAEIVAAQREDLARLDALMRDLLDITRLESGVTPPRFNAVAPRELVEAAFHAVASQAESKGIKLEMTVAPDLQPVRADRAPINRVLVNLLNNAIRHTEEGGAVRIAAQTSPPATCPEGTHLGKERGDRLVSLDEVNKSLDAAALSSLLSLVRRGVGGEVSFTVSDTGEGIPPQNLPHIFERFVQVPGATRGGAGLGLSIAQTIIKAHESEITVESELGKGSVFSFALPATEE